MSQFTTIRYTELNDAFFVSRVWDYGGIASKGLAQVAKWGSTRALESELKAESSHIRYFDLAIQSTLFYSLDFSSSYN